MNKALDLIFDEWKANLAQRDRSAAAVSGNFEELFQELKRAGATLDEVHIMLPRIIKAHQPNASLARNIYKVAKTNPKTAGMSEKEFIGQWNEDISNKATAAFFEVFPRDKLPDPDDDGEPKVYGNMSEKEYKAQRKYADSFPRLDTKKLKRAIDAVMYNPLDDFESFVGEKKDGESK